MFRGFFKRKKRKREEKLLKMYERGEYLRVDEDVDNKLFLEEKKNTPEPEEEVVQEVQKEVLEVPEEEVTKPLTEEELEAEEEEFKKKIKVMLEEDEQKEY